MENTRSFVRKFSSLMRVTSLLYVKLLYKVTPDSGDSIAVCAKPRLQKVFRFKIQRYKRCHLHSILLSVPLG